MHYCFFINILVVFFLDIHTKQEVDRRYLQEQSASAEVGIIISEINTNARLASIGANATFTQKPATKKYDNTLFLNLGAYHSPFDSLFMIDHTIQKRDGKIILTISYQLNSSRIEWGKTGLYINLEKKGQAASTGKGSAAFIATFVFDDRSMVLISQSSDNTTIRSIKPAKVKPNINYQLDQQRLRPC